MANKVDISGYVTNSYKNLRGGTTTCYRLPDGNITSNEKVAQTHWSAFEKGNSYYVTEPGLVRQKKEIMPDQRGEVSAFRDLDAFIGMGYGAMTDGTALGVVNGEIPKEIPYTPTGTGNTPYSYGLGNNNNNNARQNTANTLTYNALTGLYEGPGGTYYDAEGHMPASAEDSIWNNAEIYTSPPSVNDVKSSLGSSGPSNTANNLATNNNVVKTDTIKPVGTKDTEFKDTVTKKYTTTALGGTTTVGGTKATDCAEQHVWDKDILHDCSCKIKNCAVTLDGVREALVSLMAALDTHWKTEGAAEEAQLYQERAASLIEGMKTLNEDTLTFSSTMDEVAETYSSCECQIKGLFESVADITSGTQTIDAMSKTYNIGNVSV